MTIYELHPPGHFGQCQCCYAGCDCGCVEDCSLAKVKGYAGQSTFTNSNSQLHNYEPTPGPDAVCRHCHQRDFHRLHNKLTDRKSMSDVIEQLEQERQIWLDLSKSEKHRTTKASMDGTIHGLSIALRIVKNNSQIGNEA